jgi:hypothetical protein
MVSNIFNVCFLVLYVCCLFCEFCVLVLCTVSPLVYSCLFTICAQVYRPPPPGENSIAVNKYQIIYHKGRDFRKKKLSSIKCVLIFSTTSV